MLASEIMNIYSDRSIYFKKLTDIIFFNVEVDDPNNAMVIGNSISYCYNGFCEVPNVQSIYFMNILINIIINLFLKFVCMYFFFLLIIF